MKKNKQTKTKDAGRDRADGVDAGESIEMMITLMIPNILCTHIFAME